MVFIEFTHPGLPISVEFELAAERPANHSSSKDVLETGRPLACDANERIRSVPGHLSLAGFFTACDLVHSASEDPERARSGALTGDAENEVKIYTHQPDAQGLLASTHGSEYRTNHLYRFVFNDRVHTHGRSRTL